MSALSARGRRTAAALAAVLVAGVALLGANPASAADPGQVVLSVDGVVDQVVVDGRQPEQSMQVGIFVQAAGTLVALPDGLVVGGQSGQAVSLEISGDRGMSKSEMLSEVAQPDPGDTAHVVAVTPLASGTFAATAASSVLGTHTLTVLPVYWSSPDAATVASLGAVAAWAAQYWREQSFGAIDVTSSVRPWAPITDPGSCDPTALWNSALAANGLSDQGGNHHVLVYFPARSDCRWSGLGSVGGSRIWVNGAQNVDVMAHELGHNLGLGHAGTAACGSGAARVALTLPVAATCSLDEYGDGADVMGIGMFKATGNLNSALADALGLAVVQHVSAGQTVTVDLAPLSQPTALRAVAIDVAGGTVFVDFRPASGRDVRVPQWAGVQVHLRVPDPSAGHPRSYLLDMKPTTAQPFESAALDLGSSWQVPGTSQFVTVRATGSTATVTVGPAALSAAPGAYVAQVYQDLFGRAPDADGLVFWTSMLASGTPRSAVADDITSSEEFRGSLIAGSYATYLGRQPDVDGKRFWLGKMTAGMTIQQMESGFLASDEYYLQAGSTDTTWIAHLYQHVLGRSAAPEEVGFWASRIAGGASRGSVALGFLLSTEHLTSAVDAEYRVLLHRSIDPSGATTWVSQLQSSVRFEQVIGSIVASDEYLRLSQH